jgi:thioredoxin reductase
VDPGAARETKQQAFSDMYDAIIVGGGPAGLSAALVLGRCRRRVLVCDAGEPRNAASQALHGWLTRDGIHPARLLELGRAEVASYGTEILDARVDEATALPQSERPAWTTAFQVTLGDGRRFLARKLLLATGMRDELPDVASVDDFYGRGVHHCPYCDGWEYRDGRLAAFGTGQAVVGLARSLKTWSARVTACTHGQPLDEEDRQALTDAAIDVREERVLRLEAGPFDPSRLARILFEDGTAAECDALFFNTGKVQQSPLPARLGCEPGHSGEMRTRGAQHTGVPGLYLAGDADGDVQFAVVAAAEGARAAVAINRELQKEDEEAPE